jgi:hypothetical protein
MRVVGPPSNFQRDPTACRGGTVVPTESTVSRNEGKSGVAVRIEQVIIARINNGGPVLRFKSLNGNINIRKTE